MSRGKSSNRRKNPEPHPRDDGGAAILVQDVTKRFGDVCAVEAVSFRVGTGEIVGFLGPNGAGKTTLLKMMSTWLPPTSGHIEIRGLDVQSQPLAVRRVIGYLPEHNSLYETMQVDRFLAFVGRLRGLAASRLAERMEWLTEKCGLSEILDKRIQECSKGNRQRIGLAAALIHDPPVILLDEPTHGLDPLQVQTFLELIGQLREGRAILFSNHILSELLAVSDRILILNRGRLRADVTVEELRMRARSESKESDRVVLEIIRQKEVSR